MTIEQLPDTIYIDGPNWHLDATRGEAYIRKSEYDRLAAEVARLREAQTAAARDVLAERARQISAEGWTPEHDDTNSDGEMAQAAACYALNAAGWKTEALRGCWPIKWSATWFKPSTTRRDLVKAGALTLAEIERLDRAALQRKAGE